MAYTDLNSIPTLDAAEIFRSDVFELMKYQSYYFIESNDKEAAAVFSQQLEKIIQSLSPQSNQAHYEVLVFWMLRLKLFGFENLSQTEQADVFKKYLVTILTFGLDLKQTLFNFIENFDSRGIIEDITKTFINYLLSSEQVLGSEKSFGSDVFKPYIKNWLTDYQQSLNRRGRVLNPGAFDVANFMDSNRNIRQLSLNEKEMLRNLLELYNWLLDPILEVGEKEWAELKGVSPEFSSSYITQEKFTLPESVMVPKIPPQIPTPSGQPQAKKVGMSEITNSQFPIPNEGGKASNQNVPKKEELVINEKRAGIQTMPGVDIKSILPGYNKPIPPAVVTAETLAAKMGKAQEQNSQFPIPNSQSDKQAKIDKKLKDLETRVKGREND